MYASKVRQNLSPDDLEETEEPGMEGQKPTKSQRRLSDSLNSKGRKLKLDRRVDGGDRRTDMATGNKSPARRKVIDRRESLDDRRDED